MTLRRVGLVIGIVILGAATVGYFRWYQPTRYAVGIGAGMLAKQMCSCIFVADREVEACRADQMPSMDRIQLEVKRDPDGVRAFVPMFGERLAIHREGLGCTLQ